MLTERGNERHLRKTNSCASVKSLGKGKHVTLLELKRDPGHLATSKSAEQDRVQRAQLIP